MQSMTWHQQNEPADDMLTGSAAEGLAESVLSACIVQHTHTFRNDSHRYINMNLQRLALKSK